MLRKSGGIDDFHMVEDTHSSLIILADSISRYPSIFHQQAMGIHLRSVETLVESLCENPDISFILNIPTKAILGRGFTIAKINFFIMLSYLCREHSLLCPSGNEIRDIITRNIFSILAEEVFISIISDPSINKEIRTETGFLLAGIWEQRIYGGIEEFIPVLSDIWRARINFTPAYGTMAGISEIAKFCIATNSVWINFMEDKDFNDDSLESLREYLMGLSHEEMTEIENYMAANSITSFRHEHINGMLGRKKSYHMENHDDPREMYQFYVRRKNNAIFRKKGHIKGPTRTIEEHLICYMIHRGIIKGNRDFKTGLGSRS